MKQFVTTAIFIIFAVVSAAAVAAVKTVTLAVSGMT